MRRAKLGIEAEAIDCATHALDPTMIAATVSGHANIQNAVAATRLGAVPPPTARATLAALAGFLPVVPITSNFFREAFSRLRGDNFRLAAFRADIERQE